MKLKINDFVELLDMDPGKKLPNGGQRGGEDRFARVVAIEKNGIRVSNLNMPFIGSLCNHFIANGRYKKA